MNINSIKLTVLFEDPFWVGVFERVNVNGYSVARIVFGAEPTNIELCKFLLRNYAFLKFSNPLDDFLKPKNLKSINPKRRKRVAQKELNNKSTVSKAHEAIKLMQEQTKIEKKHNKKLCSEEVKLQKFALKQLKKKNKRRGR